VNNIETKKGSIMK